MTTCTDTDPSYIYWNADGTTQSITFHEFRSNQWLFSDPTNSMNLTLVGSPTTNQQFIFKQIENTTYDGYLKYGDKVYLVQDLCGSPSCTQTVPFYATGSSEIKYTMAPSPNCAGVGYPLYDYVTLESQTAEEGTGVRFDDPVAVNGYPCSECSDGAKNYWSDANAGSPIGWACSPVYSYSIHDSSKSTPTQKYYSCVGTVCEYSSSNDGASCTSCLGTCGQSGSVLPSTSSTYKPFPGVSSLPLAGCAANPATHTYTLYSGLVTNLELLFILGETTTSVSKTVPKKIKNNKQPSSNGVLLFTYTADGSATFEAPATNNVSVSWGANSKWESWGTGGNSKIITVGLTMDGLSLTLNGKTRTVSFIDMGYTSGLFCNLYAAQGVADDGPKLTVAGAKTLTKFVQVSPMAPNWWWYGLVSTGLIAIVMILLIAWLSG